MNIQTTKAWVVALKMKTSVIEVRKARKDPNVKPYTETPKINEEIEIKETEDVT